jgi:hypothetical protein
MLTLKFCFQNEIHKCSKLPTDYESLLQAVQTVFKDQLAGAFDLQYEDCDGDKVMLSNEEDYQAMLESESKNKSVKVYITPKGEQALFQMRASTLSNNSNESPVILKTEDNFQIIDKKPVESKIVEIPQIEGIKEVEIKDEDLPQLNQETQTIIKVLKDLPVQTSEIKPEVVEEKVDIMKLVNKALEEKIPELTKSIQEKMTQSMMASQKVDSNDNKEVVHTFVKCDGCGVKPIIGARYKCSVCYDFDYCQNCEASKEHAHPFLKIKDSAKQRHYGMDDQPFQGMKKRCAYWKCKALEGFMGACGKAQEQAEAIKAVFHPQEEVKVEQPKQEEPKKEVPKKPEAPKQPIEEIKLYDVALVKEIKSVPEVVYPADKELYKTIVIKNTGIMDYPAGAYIKNLDQEWSQKVLLPVLEIGKEYSCILRIKSKQTIGKHIAKWSVAFRNDQAEEEVVGSPLVITYEVVEKQYSNDIVAKAKKLQEMFPGKETKFYCECVKTAGNVSMEDLIENFLHKNA